MEHLPVHWYEGMFIGPHHFQANDRYWNDRLARELKWGEFENYGLKSFEFNKEALKNSMVEITNLEARFRDGSIVRYGQTRELDRLSISGEFGDSREIFVFLCVRRRDLSGPNVGEAATARYEIAEADLEDENTGGNERQIDLRHLSCYLEARPVDRERPDLPERVAPRGVESLPIMRIRISGADEALPEFDPTYFPPVISTDACLPLRDDVIRPIYHLLGQNVDLLGQRVRNRELSFSRAHDEGDLDDLYKLTLLNRCYATLKNFGVVRAVHPLTVFVELCRLYGDLAIFGDESASVDRDIPAYNHDDLQTVFTWLKVRIESLVRTERFRWEKEDFVGSGEAMVANIRGHWLEADWVWFLAVKGVDENRFLRLLKDLNWKFASHTQISNVFYRRDVDLDLEGPVGVPRELAQDQGWVFYKVAKKGPAWSHVLQDKTLAVMINPNVISNNTVPQGRRTMQLTIDDIQLQFRLFAIPRQSQT